MQEEIEQLETEQSKRHYEKPAVAAVRLFADQVLQNCNPDTNGGDSDKLSF